MKKILTILLSVALVLGAVMIPTVFSATDKTGYILGDADGSGKIEMVDATFVQRYIADITVNIPYKTLLQGDIDRSGELEITDATYIQRYLADMDVPYPIGEFIETAVPTEPVLTDPTFVVEEIEAQAGDTVLVAVNIRNNPGVLGMTLALSYDSSVMTLTNAVSGSAVSDVLAFTKPGRFTNPCNFTWDGIEIDDSQIRDGELLILTFAVSVDAADGVYPITISYDEDSIIDKDLNPVDFAIVNGSVTIGEASVDPTSDPDPTQPSTEAPITGPAFIADKVQAVAGGTATVAVNIKNNPGILGMTLTLSYDSSVMTLTNAVSGSAVSDVLAFTKPGRFTNPCNFTWDGIEIDDSQIRDGELLILTFAIAENATDKVYPITVSYEEDSIFDKNLSAVEFTVINGNVTIGDAEQEPTVPPQPTQPETEPPVTGPAFVIGKEVASAGGTVELAVSIENNPGILGMTLTLSYDSSVLTLKNASSGSAVSDVLAFTKPGRFTSPCNFTWDGIELSEDQIKDGELLILTFDVSANAAGGSYPITLSYEEDSIINAELLPVNVAVVNGSVTVG